MFFSMFCLLLVIRKFPLYLVSGIFKTIFFYIQLIFPLILHLSLVMISFYLLHILFYLHFLLLSICKFLFILSPKISIHFIFFFFFLCLMFHVVEWAMSVQLWTFIYSLKQLHTLILSPFLMFLFYLIWFDRSFSLSSLTT